VFGTLEEDVWRRDFTVNALYYNIRGLFRGRLYGRHAGSCRRYSAIDWRSTGSLSEDPVRMLRAVRFAVKLGFSLHPETEQPIHEQHELLKSIPSARLYDEMLKLFLAGYGLQTFEMLRHFGLFSILFPAVDKCLETQDHDFPRLFLARALENSDKRFADGKSLTPYFLLAALLWEPLQIQAQNRIRQGENETIAWQNAANEILTNQIKLPPCPGTLPRRCAMSGFCKNKLTRTTGSRPYRLLEQPKFRAAYDFLQLRAETGGADPELVVWWTRFQEASDDERLKMTAPPKGGAGKPRRKSGRYRPRATQANQE